jgi:hypothetical protein
VPDPRPVPGPELLDLGKLVELRQDGCRQRSLRDSEAVKLPHRNENAIDPPGAARPSPLRAGNKWLGGEPSREQVQVVGRPWQIPAGRLGPLEEQREDEA